MIYHGGILKDPIGKLHLFMLEIVFFHSVLPGGEFGILFIIIINIIQCRTI